MKEKEKENEVKILKISTLANNLTIENLSVRLCNEKSIFSRQNEILIIFLFSSMHLNMHI